MKKLKFARALWKSVKEFLAKTSVHSYHYLVEPNRHMAEKIMWCILHLISTVTAFYLIMVAWGRFTDNPTITTLESQQYSVLDIPFPAVAICSNNKISKSAADQYAQYLIAKQALNPGIKLPRNLQKLVRYMGRMYDSDIEGMDEFVKFQDFLDTIDLNVTTGMFDAKEKLGMLAPKCKDLIVKCKWGGKSIDCHEIIETRRTSEGFCCTFNYVRPMEKNAVVKIPRKPSGIGPEQGLTVLVNLTSVDYYYPLKTFVGATILIYDPSEFADSCTGGVREVPMEPNQELRITTQVETKIAVPEVQRYSIQKRGCMFPNDLLDEYNGNYVFGDCLVKCKLKSVLALCKCIPYNSPVNFPDIDASIIICSLAHMECLNKYKSKWRTFRPREVIKGLERELEDSLNCDSCFPLCSSTTYIVDSTSSKLNYYYGNRGSVIAKVAENQELSVLKVYFPTSDSILYKIDVLFAWYDVVSDYGGLTGLCLGCSIISIFEFLYFVTLRFYQNLFNSMSFMNKFNQKHKSNIFGPVRNLYRPKFEYLN
ncbi:unnamed protein product [Diamesa hyperborea]